MTNNELENKISKAFSNAVPDVFDNIMDDIKKSSTEPETKNKKQTKKQTKKRSNLIKIFVAIAVAAAVVIAAIGVSSYSSNSVLAATVSLDVNPGIEITVNKKHKVLNVNPTTDDAKDVIGDMDFKGADLEVTVNALIGAMISKGYLSELANSILISVDSSNQDEANALQEYLMGEINTLLQNDAYSAALLGQTITDNAELNRLASEYGITVGKAQLIKDITERDSRYSFEDLVALSINELNLLQNSSSDKLTSIGTASDKAYIGEAKAKEVAFNDASVAANSVYDLKVELDYEDGRMIYEIDFKSGNSEYEYDINAITGAIVKKEKETKTENTNASGSGSQSSVKSSGSQSSAATPATQPATQAATQPSTTTATQSAKQQTTAATKASTSKYIGKAKAKTIALNHAGVSGGQVKELEIDFDDDDEVYEVDFKSGKYEYEYEINAKTGKIISVDKEYDD